MLLVGLVFGPWWWATIPVGTIAWVVLLVATDVGSGLSFALGAAAFGAANIIVGVLVYQALAWMIRRVRPTSRSRSTG
jgi:tellurite resistance protein TehA-like permease